MHQRDEQHPNGATPFPEGLEHLASNPLFLSVMVRMQDPAHLRELEERRRAGRRDGYRADTMLSMQIYAARRAQGRIANPHPRAEQIAPRRTGAGVSRPRSRRNGRRAVPRGPTDSDAGSSEPPGEPPGRRSKQQIARLREGRRP